jgi:hypothetical protein
MASATTKRTAVRTRTTTKVTKVRTKERTAITSNNLSLRVVSNAITMTLKNKLILEMKEQTTVEDNMVMVNRTGIKGLTRTTMVQEIKGTAKTKGTMIKDLVTAMIRTKVGLIKIDGSLTTTLDLCSLSKIILLTNLKTFNSSQGSKQSKTPKFVKTQSPHLTI